MRCRFLKPSGSGLQLSEDCATLRQHLSQIVFLAGVTRFGAQEARHSIVSFDDQLSRSTRCSAWELRIELGVPIEIVEPAVVKVVRRKQPAVPMQLMHGRRIWRLLGEHLGLLRCQIALPQIAGRAGRHDIFPGGLTTFGARDDVIESEVLVGRAVLADKAIAEEDVEAGEGGVGGRFDEGF